MGILYLGRPFTGPGVWRFAVRRIARVVPLYYIVLTLSVLAAALGQWFARDLTIYAIEPSDLIYHYGFVHGVSVFWTIPVELQFYVAFVVIWLIHSKSPTICWIAVVAALAWFLVRAATPLAEAMPSFPDSIGYFLAGLLLSRVLQKFSAGPLWTIAFACSVGLTLLLFPGVKVAIFGTANLSDLGQLWHDPLYLLTVSALLLTSLFAPIANKVLANRFMVHSGRVSYSMYLLHVPVIVLLTRYTSAGHYPFVFLGLVLTATLVVSTASFRLIEWPLRAFIGKAAYAAGAEESQEHAVAS
jgi:peptidoglycan/LPS O-acetylase OafA/YrhL